MAVVSLSSNQRSLQVNIGGRCHPQVKENQPKVSVAGQLWGEFHRKAFGPLGICLSWWSQCPPQRSSTTPAGIQHRHFRLGFGNKLATDICTNGKAQPMQVLYTKKLQTLKHQQLIMFREPEIASVEYGKRCTSDEAG